MALKPQKPTWVAIMNPLQQGLKPGADIYYTGTILVAIMNPLQQGLKRHSSLDISLPPPPRCNNESTTTRIETHSLRILIIRMQVAIMNPLQQGLKPPTTFVNVSSLMVAIMNPLQQGLKHKMLLNTLYGKFGLQ